MKIIKKFTDAFKSKQMDALPLLIITQQADDTNVIEYGSIEEAIHDLEKDPNVSAEKIEKLRSSFKNLKNKRSIKIINGEIVK